MIASDSLTIEIGNQYISLLIVFAKLNSLRIRKGFDRFLIYVEK